MPDQYREPIEKEQSGQEMAPIENNPIEQEILELERQLIEKREAARKEKLETVVGQENMISGQAAQPVAPPSASQPQPAQVQSDIAKLSGIEKNQQLKNLVDMAFLKGVAHATEVARNLDNPYLLDEFHDTLIDEFHKKLVEEGKLEEI